MGCCESLYDDDEQPALIPPSIRPITNPTAWSFPELLAQRENIDTQSAANIVNLFENQNTIPFICRYRRDLIDSKITPDRLRNIKSTYNDIVELRRKAETVICEIEQVLDIDDDIRRHILSAKNDNELEYMKQMYKPVTSDQRTLDYYKDKAICLLIGSAPPIYPEYLTKWLDPNFNTEEKVERVLCEFIADHFISRPCIQNEIRRLIWVLNFVLRCSKSEMAPDSGSSKYENYFNFEKELRFIKPHQTLAINRAERLKFLKVVLAVPAEFKSHLQSFVRNLYNEGIQYYERRDVIAKSLEFFYNKRVIPWMYKEVRAELTDKANKKALLNFSANLKQLLLTPPVKGEPILGIDPGFKNGCKLALISGNASVLEGGVVHPHNERNDPEKCGSTLANMLAKHGCKRIALGNGTGCRETEAWLNKLFENGILNREEIRYSIVSEQGASAYSCSRVAKEEFPKLDINLISAVSIARRLNDPLSEYVKITPRNLGVGMYQHDLDEKLLSQYRNEVVSECVSYVGVDANTASQTLLRNVAGLSDFHAKNITHFRENKGLFRTRQDLMRVRGLDQKIFLQCAGFIYIGPESVDGKMVNMLDCSWVHPENYAVAENIIDQCGLSTEDFGQPHFIAKMKSYAESHSKEKLAKHFRIPAARVEVILSALQRQLCQDYRFDKLNNTSLFKANITKIEDLFIGEIVSGQVRNIVDFGVFVDIGLENDSLIHKSKLNGIKVKVGDRVSASVLDLDLSKKQVVLRLDEVVR